MSGWLIYLILKLDMLSILLGAIGITSAILAIAIVLLSCDPYKKEIDSAVYVIAYTLFWAFIISGILWLLAPTTKQAIMMYGIPTTLDAVNKNKQLIQIPEKLLIYINQELDEKIKNKERNEED